MHVRRHPNGGFVLDACWHVQTSFRMPRRVVALEGQGEGHSEDPRLDDEALDVTVEQQCVEAEAYNESLPLPCLEDMLDDWH